MATKKLHYHGAGELDPAIDALNPYPRNEQLGDWLEAFRALHDRGVRLILDWGALVSPKLDEKIAEARAGAEAAGRCPGKAAMGVRKSPLRSGWRKAAPSWEEVEEHILRGGWASWAPEEEQAVELDIDDGDIEATADHLRGLFHVAGETASVSGKRRLIVRYEGEKRPKKTWKVNGGAGECLSTKATICDPQALLGALVALPNVEPADLSILKAGGRSKQPDLTFDGEADEAELEAAIDDAVEKIEDAPEREGNNTVAGQAWRAGKAAGTSEGIDVEAARERVVEAAAERQPHEEEKARDRAGKQFDVGVESADEEPFKVRTGGPSPEIGIGPEAAQEDAAALDAWRNRPATSWPDTEIDMCGGHPADPSGLQEIRDGELGYVNDRSACLMLAAENRFPDWIVKDTGAKHARLWQFDEGTGWHELEWDQYEGPLADALDDRRYTIRQSRENEGTNEAPIWKTRYEKVNRPTESSAKGFVSTVARSMSRYVPWYTRLEWHDADPWLLAHSDGTVTDIRTLERRPLERKDRLMKRTTVAPSEWRGTWFEEQLLVNVPDEADRLVFQCGLGLGCIGHALCEAMLWLVGVPGGAKTMFQEAAQAALGGDYTYVMDVKRLLKGRGADGFSAESSRSMLHEARLAVLSGEPAPDDALNEGAYKSLVGGGSAEGRRIGKDSTALHRSPYTLVATCNKLPYAVNDEAIDRRTYVVTFPILRSEKERDAAVKQRMLTADSLSAFLGFMLEGAHMVAVRGQMPPRTAQQRQSARFPEQGEEDGGAAHGKNAARDARSGNMAARAVEDIRPLLSAAVGAPVWLDEGALGADAALLGAIDDVLRRYRFEAGLKNRAVFAAKAGFRTERRHPGKGDRAMRRCIMGPAK